MTRSLSGTLRGRVIGGNLRMVFHRREAARRFRIVKSRRAGAWYRRYPCETGEYGGIASRARRHAEVFDAAARFSSSASIEKAPDVTLAESGSALGR